MHPEKNPVNPRLKKIMIVAGEASGDLHGSNLVKEMLSLDHRMKFYGIGGEKLKNAGVEILADSSDMAVVGITEVFSKLGFILKIRHEMKKSLKKDKPDLLILIDYPDFNISLAKAAKKSGVRVFYYISPQVWAWRKKRVNDLALYVDRMAVILPFEREIYDVVNLDVGFVGHPLLDAVEKKYTREEALKIFDLKPDYTTVGILPGSRKGEIIRLLPEMLKAAEILKKRIPSIQFILRCLHLHTLPEGYLSTLITSAWSI
jgi:lipid-A-disaccharide synthase